MLLYLILLFCAVPFIELWLLFAVAKQTTPTFTLLLVLATGVIGAWLARRQGFRVLRRIEQEMSANRMPTTSLADGAMILFAGALLLTPGILTDAFGFSLLIPPIRSIYRRALMRYFQRRVRVQATHFHSRPPNDQIIDVTVVESHSQQD